MSGFSGGGWESCLGQSPLLLSISVLSPHALFLFCPSSLASWSLSPPPTSHFYLFCWYLTRQDFVFCLPWHSLFSSFGEKGKKRMRDWKFVKESFWRTFLDYVHKAQAAHSVNMARCQWDLFPWRLFLYSNNQGADSTVPQEEKKVLLPVRYTLCNILAVNTNKAMREKIMTRYQPFLALQIPILA